MKHFKLVFVGGITSYVWADTLKDALDYVWYVSKGHNLKDYEILNK